MITASVAVVGIDIDVSGVAPMIFPKIDNDVLSSVIVCQPDGAVTAVPPPRIIVAMTISFCCARDDILQTECVPVVLANENSEDEGSM